MPKPWPRGPKRRPVTCSLKVGEPIVINLYHDSLPLDFKYKVRGHKFRGFVSDAKDRSVFVKDAGAGCWFPCTALVFYCGDVSSADWYTPSEYVLNWIRWKAGLR